MGEESSCLPREFAFTLMWDAVLPIWALPSGKMQSAYNEGAESVKYLMMPKDNVLKLVKENLGPFMIKQHGFELDREIFDPSEFEDAEENGNGVPGR